MPNEQQLIEIINGVRAQFGLWLLASNEELTAAAKSHAEDSARHPELSPMHIGSDGLDGGQRIRRSGYEWREWGEVVGWGFGGDIGRMMQYWLNSAKHRKILLSPDFADIGVGVSRSNNGEWFYVVDVAA